MREDSPCLNCPSRHPACHGSCDAYKEWKERYKAQQEYTKKSRMDTFYPMNAAQEKHFNRNLRFTLNAYRRTRRQR